MWSHNLNCRISIFSYVIETLKYTVPPFLNSFLYMRVAMLLLKMAYITLMSFKLRFKFVQRCHLLLLVPATVSSQHVNLGPIAPSIASLISEVKFPNST